MRRQLKFKFPLDEHEPQRVCWQRMVMRPTQTPTWGANFSTRRGMSPSAAATRAAFSSAVRGGWVVTGRERWDSIQELFSSKNRAMSASFIPKGARMSTRRSRVISTATVRRDERITWASYFTFSTSPTGSVTILPSSGGKCNGISLAPLPVVGYNGKNSK